jgi:hypothetical protein
MLKGFFLEKIGITPKHAIANIILVTNVFVWYFGTFVTLKDIMSELQLGYSETLLMWSVNFGAAALSALIGAILVSRIHKRMWFLGFWVIFGVLSSLLLMLATSNILMLSLLLGISFGLGMPTCMGYFSGSTVVEKRAGFGGIILFLNYAGTFLLLTAMLVNSSTFMRAFVLAVWRGLGLTILLIGNSSENISKNRSLSYASILSQRPFLFYFIPWIMFSLVNYLSMPMQYMILGETLSESLILIENILVGIFAIIGGFLSDFFGRKRMAITGFVMLGLGYAILGIYPANLASWYFYTLVDGAAWGVLSAIFLMAIWGDLAHEVPSEKYYALGGLPYLLSSFLRIVLGSYIVENVPAYAIFSFAAFFLFLAVFPLMYAPETLPEKQIREREIKDYIEKAKKIKKKFT